jgi:hypothetical protein
MCYEEKASFAPSRAESDIWMRRIDENYEYLLCVYHVDGIIICSHNPQAIVDALLTKHKFSLKGTGPIYYHLGCDYTREPCGIMYYY